MREKLKIFCVAVQIIVPLFSSFRRDIFRYLKRPLPRVLCQYCTTRIVTLPQNVTNKTFFIDSTVEIWYNTKIMKTN